MYRKSKDKIWRELPEGSHNDSVAEPGYFDYIEEFIQHQVLEGKDTKKL